MNKREIEKLRRFEEILHDFFRRAGREHLPWRKSGITAYEVWVSEIMLQQTQVSRVIGYYGRFLRRFPTVQELAKVSWEEFLPYYAGLGYYARGRNMIGAAKAVVAEYGGEFPRDPKELETLPGVGPYTAAAIASFAYGKNFIAWDTNLRRVVGRFFFGSKRADIPFDVFETAFSLPAKELNAALMDFGSAICVSRPKCGACPIRDRCEYFKTGGKSELRFVDNETVPSRKLQSPNSKNQTHSKFNPPTGGKNSKIDRQRWKDAQVMLFLHEGHRKYYSSKKSVYAPFTVPASHNTRAGIKDWFRDRFGLELAVRPSHGRVVIGENPTLLVNAQILLGEAGFPVFTKEAFGVFVDRLND